LSVWARLPLALKLLATKLKLKLKLLPVVQKLALVSSPSSS
jgi:hypothetical protein